MPLAGMPAAGCSESGDSIAFTLETQDGKTFSFACAHEAVTEIVENLVLAGDTAWKKRGSPNLAESAAGAERSARARTATGMLISMAREGVTLSLQCGPLTHDILLPSELCLQLADSLHAGHETWKRTFQPN